MQRQMALTWSHPCQCHLIDFDVLIWSKHWEFDGFESVHTVFHSSTTPFHCRTSKHPSCAGSIFYLKIFSWLLPVCRCTYLRTLQKLVSVKVPIATDFLLSKDALILKSLVLASSLVATNTAIMQTVLRCMTSAAPLHLLNIPWPTCREIANDSMAN